MSSIEFEHRLPAMHINGKTNGVYNNAELAYPGLMTTTDPEPGLFLHTLRTNLYDDRSLIFIDGKVLMANKNWIRDYVHIMKGMKHFEYRLLPFLDFIINTQREDGQYYELIKQMDDEHWKMVNEDCRILYPEDNLSLVRLELEADIEYLVVEGAYVYYQVSGDDDWLKKVLPKLEKGIDYVTSDPKRWDSQHGLVMRPFTIDTWDFTPEISSQTDRRIHPDEKMSIMHGDNSGVFQAMHQLAFFNERFGDKQKAATWRKRASEIQQNMFRYLWNGHFFIHQLHLNHKGIDDLESERLSLSNTYDMNRGVTNLAQSRSIIEEYRRRRQTTSLFSEWFTIDPPYSVFQSYSAGRYVNGAISPFTAGELSKAAFRNGYEAYGWDILQRMMSLVKRDGTVYFLYNPDSTPQPEGGPSAWGSAALMSAFDEGLAGIIDSDVQYRKIDFSPRFTVTPYKELRYLTGYEAVEAKVDVRFIEKDYGMRYDIESPAHQIHAHLLLPAGKTAKHFFVNGKPYSFEIVQIADSLYVDTDVEAQGCVSFEVMF